MTRSLLASLTVGLFANAAPGVLDQALDGTRPALIGRREPAIP